ncbi:MAG TPA: malectin domain-containing carbohydrate-binding protein [Rhabdochlamydiaceae bacterium]|jgi:C1A family cysteine protease
MHFIKKHFVSLLCVIGVMSLNAAAPPTKQHGKGHVPHTPEQLKKIEQTWPRIVDVKPNAVGLKRIQEHLKNQGRESQHLQSVSHEQEFVKVVGANEHSKLSDANSALPASVNNSTLTSFPPIGDQQQEGSCVAWGSTYYQASHELGLLNGYNNKNDFTHVLSPRWTYNLLNGGQDGGLVPDYAFTLLSQNGAPSITSFSYVNGDVTSWDLQIQDWVTAISNRLAPPQYVAGIGGASQNLQTIKQLLTNGHVLTFATFIDSWVFTSVLNDPQNPNSPYVGQYACTYLDGREGGHFMTIVGYDDNIWIDVNGNGQVDSGERGAFLVANSWGNDWGNSGFIWISYDAFLNTSAVLNGPRANRVAAATAENNYVFCATPKASHYAPKLIGMFALNQNFRDQISIQGGVSDTTQTAPAQTFDCYALMNQGGPLEFDGSTPGSPETATFAVDMSDLVNPSGITQRFYLVAGDDMSGSPTTVESFALYDLVNQQQVNCSSLPQSCDNSQIAPYIDYALSQPQKVSINVNCGDGTISYGGMTWATDYGYTTSHVYSNANVHFANPIYNTQRWAPTFSYSFNVPNGNYSVQFNCAEIYFTAPNKRVFNISLNGHQVVSHLDVYKMAGFATPYLLQYPVTVTNGILSIQFTSVVNNATLCGFAISSL